ncbi:SufD family Fe-S cluster assembly protein [Candidatus Daviesbacteria bacterium]|nr:SufD family Fe-S cluster assembly protein [Candidatus Daviesbacteria bacterium]
MQKIFVGKDQEKVIPIFWLGDKNVLQEQEIILAAPGAKIILLGLLFGLGQSQFATKTKIVHAASNTVSQTIFKGVLKDYSQINFDGLVKIDKGATGANAYMSAKFLLLSDQAKARAVPSLEIDENEVVCGHAAAVGKIDQEQLFYLMSRGLSRSLAVKQIVKGFFIDVAGFLPDGIKLQDFSQQVAKSIN